MANLILLVLCLAAGLLLRKSGRFPAGSPAALNSFIIHVSLPALALLHVHAIRLDASLWFPATMAWVLFGAGLLFFHLLGRVLKLSRPTVGALMLLCGLGNTSFVGLPMIEAYYGKAYLGIGLIADQLGSFLVLSTFGILIAAIYSSGEISPRQVAKRVLLFPPFEAMLLALLLSPVPFPPWLSTVLQRLGDTLTPLALTSVGFQLSLRGLRGQLRPLGLGLLYKLVFGPALLTLLFVVILGGQGATVQVTLFEAAMAPMITAGIVAVEHDLNPPLVTLLLGIGIPLSFLTLPAWWWLLQRV
jgi:predicted permease